MSIGVRMFSYKYVVSVYLLCLAYALYVMLGGKERGDRKRKEKTRLLTQG